MKNLDVSYSRLDIESVIQELAPQYKQKMVKRAEKALAKARTKDSMTAFSKLTESVNGHVQIVDQSPLIVPLAQLLSDSQRGEMFESLHQILRGYRESLEFDRRVLLEQFELADFARKVVGVGSVGTRAWIALMLGRDGQDPLFLQMKEAEASVLEECHGPSEFSNHGERVVVGQRLTQATSDIFLGWLHVDAGLDNQPRDFYGRQLKDWKARRRSSRWPQGLRRAERTRLPTARGGSQLRRDHSGGRVRQPGGAPRPAVRACSKTRCPAARTRCALRSGSSCGRCSPQPRGT